METINKPTRKERKKLRKVLKKPVRRVIKEVKENIDHLIAKAENWSECYINKKKGKASKHLWKHLFFDNMTPDKQIMEILKYNYPTLNKETRVEIVESIASIIEWHLKNWTFYNERCFKKKSYIPKKL